MERYLYIFIISIFFLCICLVCNGCMKIYDRFSVGNDVIGNVTRGDNTRGINISKELTLTYDPSCDVKSLDIKDQPDSTIQIINNTTEDFFHVFITSNSIHKIWTKVGGNGAIEDPVDWTYINPNTQAGITWSPLGAEIASQIIIPKNGNIVLLNPMKYIDPGPGNPVSASAIFKVIPMRLKTDNIFKSTDEIQKNKNTLIYTQEPITIEAGEGAVADISAVNGINYNVEYELTSIDANQINKIKKMTIKKNPCLGLNQEYKLNIGCHSPFIVDCKEFTDGIDSHASCECKSNTQNCKFNKCSESLFNITPKLEIYKESYDGGKPDEPVKLFINAPINLKDGSQQKKYCDDLQDDSGDFKAYCYDYNDVGSSPTLMSPYKIKITYSEL